MDNLNYESLTKSAKRKDDVFTDETTDTDKSNDNDTINDNSNDILNEKIDHGLQSTYGDRNGLQIINYGDDNHPIESYSQVRNSYIRVIKMHVVTISSLTEATPSPTKEHHHPW